MNKKHGMYKHPVYRAWQSMKYRCLNETARNYDNYGGRGIQVCERWMVFENFRQDMLPVWKLGLSLDRINNNGYYEPGNCRWATRSEQQRNKRVFSKKARQKMSQAHTGHRHSDTTIRKIQQSNKKTWSCPRLRRRTAVARWET